jgi:nicotinamidase-related amidase
LTDTAPPIDPARTALLIMDFQPAVLGGLPQADALLGRVADAIDVARARGVAVGYVRVGFEDADYDAVPDTNKTFAGIVESRRMPAARPESAVHDAIAPQPDDIVVRKTRVAAFSTTDLDRRLRDRGIDTLVLAGIHTSGVVLSTVREAADRDYRLYVLDDASADPDAEVHDLLMGRIFARQAYVVSVADLPDLLAS